MLAIRLKRTGRKGHAQFRVIVQDSHRSPYSGKVVAYLGSYNPHIKVLTIDKPEVERFLSNGAQPSNKVAMLLKNEGVKLPSWVKIDESKKGELRNPEKLRKNQPEEEKVPEAPAEEAPAEAPAEEASEEKATDEAPAAEEAKEEAPAEESSSAEASDDTEKAEEPEEAKAEEGSKDEAEEAPAEAESEEKA